MFTAGGDFDEINHVWTQDRLGHPAAPDCVGRNDFVGAGALEFYVWTFLTRACQDIKIGVESAGGQDDVDVLCIWGDDWNKPFSPLDARLEKCFIQRGVTLEVQVAIFIQFFCCLDVFLNDDKLITEGLCTFADGHYNHAHISIKPSVLSMF